MIITYRELRLLEFEVLKMIYDNNQIIFLNKICKVKIEQFYGIEYEEFPSQIAHVGMLLMKHQMDRMVSNYFGMNYIDFPIKDSATIVHENALQIDWQKIIPKEELHYIIGNPPFVGYKLQSPEQKKDMIKVFPKAKNLDYVSAWYIKASDYTEYTTIKCGFVSTNSIVQGEHVTTLWKYLVGKNIIINFAYRTFIWSNEAKGKAAVHCVIIGFSHLQNNNKKVYVDNNNIIYASNINPYLLDAPTTIIEKHSKPIFNVPSMIYGSEPREGGNLILSEEEAKEYIKEHIELKPYIKRFISAEDYINNKYRYCLWLKDADISKLLKYKKIKERLERVKEFREKSKQKQAHEAAAVPYLFSSDRQPDTDYLVIPVTSASSRRYIPIGYVSKEVIASNACFTIPNASLYEFGILSSNVHNAWMRTVCGRLKSDYRYSNTIVYNNFPFPEATEIQKIQIKKLAQNILDVREKYKNRTLASLYNRLSMPNDLLKAHRNLDKAVCKLYGHIWKSEEECVADLMKIYKRKIEEIKS